MKLSAAEGELRIADASAADEGNFTCVVSAAGSRGRESAVTYRLVVQGRTIKESMEKRRVSHF